MAAFAVRVRAHALGAVGALLIPVASLQLLGWGQVVDVAQVIPCV